MPRSYTTIVSHFGVTPPNEVSFVGARGLLLTPIFFHFRKLKVLRILKICQGS